MGTCGRRFRRAFSPKSSVFSRKLACVARRFWSGAQIRQVGQWNCEEIGAGAAPPLVRERAHAFAASPLSVPDKPPFYAGYNEIVLLCNATSEVEQPGRRKRRRKQENQNSNGFSYNPTKTLKRCWTRFAQPRLQRFSLKKWVGSTHFLREKPWGRGCVLQIFYRPSRGWNRQCNLRFNFQDLRFINNDQAVTSISSKIYAYRVSP